MITILMFCNNYTHTIKNTWNKMKQTHNKNNNKKNKHVGHFQQTVSVHNKAIFRVMI